MNTNPTVEYIQAETNSYPSDIWTLTVLDQSCYPMVLRGTWIFDSSLNIDKMKVGLKKLLNYYPHLSGRMKDKKSIHLTNDGVSFTVKDELNLSIKEVNEKNNIFPHFFTEIKPSKIRRGIDPPMSIKISNLKDGCVLGIKCSHMCMDGDSFYTMVHNWAQLCNNKDFKPPVLNQSLIPATDNLTKKQVKEVANKQGWKKISTLHFLKLLPKLMLGILKKRTNAFYFSVDSIKRIQQKISTDSGFRCSSNVALSALISKMFMKLFNYDETMKCKQVSVVNIRERLDEIPSNFVGNASTFVTTPSFSADSSINEIAKIIHQTLEPIRKKPSTELKKMMSLSINLMNHKLYVFPFDFTEMHSKIPTVIHINNFTKLHIYDIDFGSGKPISVIPHDLGDQVLIWPANPKKGGVEIYFSGRPTQIINNMKKEDPWPQEMKQYA